MAKYKAYPEYKTTGLGWLTEIPDHWEVKKLKYLGQAIIGLTYSPDDVVDEGEGTLVLRSSNIQKGKLEFLDNVYVRKSIPLHLKVKEGDILICARNGSRALIGKNAKITKDAEGMTFGAFMSIFRSGYNNYLSHVFASALFEYQSGSFLTATINQLTTSNLNSFEIPLPPQTEQGRIVNFLDHETAKIDNLIEKQRQLIELLKEKRQAVISHAVTKGLNPDVPMKDSGVEWLGEVPKHWVPIQLGKICYQVSDGPHFSPNYVDSGVLFISARNIKVNGWSLDDAKYITEKDYNKFSKRVIPEIGDVLYTKGGTTGIARTVDIEDKFQVWVHVAVLKILKDKAVPDFIAYSLNGTSCYAQSQLYTQGATNNDLGLTRLIKIWLALPPKNEQQEIVDALNSITKKYDVVTDNAMAAITILQECRTALISAAVTGKIDVRDWVAPDTQDVEESQEAIA